MGINWAGPVRLPALEIEPIVPKEIISDSKVVYVTTGEVIRAIDVETGAELRVLRGHQSGIRHLCISPDGSMLASRSRTYGADCSIKLWDAKTTALLHIFEGRQDSAERLGFTGDSCRLISILYQQYGGFRVWEVASKSLLHSVSFTEYVQFACFSPDAAFFAFSQRSKIVIWETRAGMGAVKSPHMCDIGVADKICFSPCNRLLAASTQAQIPSCKILVWQLKVGVSKCGTCNTILSIQRYRQFRSDGTRDGNSGLVFNNTSSLLIVGAILSITVWDIATGAVVLTKDCFYYVSTIICLSTSTAHDNLPVTKQIIAVDTFSKKNGRQYVECIEVDCAQKSWVCFKRIAIEEDGLHYNLRVICFEPEGSGELVALLNVFH